MDRDKKLLSNSTISTTQHTSSANSITKTTTHQTETNLQHDEIENSTNSIYSDDLIKQKRNDDSNKQYRDGNEYGDEDHDDQLVIEFDDEEDDYDEEDDELTQLSPMVLVKYPVNYEYDNKKFKLIEGEKLFLLNKANSDWWLCLRLDENLTFFVPASYVKEIHLDNNSVVPPPRPPPPPPDVIKKFNKSLKRKPEVKKRQMVNRNKSIDENYDEETKLQENIYENLSNTTEKPCRKQTPSNSSNSSSNIQLSATSETVTKTPEPDYDEKNLYQNLSITQISKMNESNEEESTQRISSTSNDLVQNTNEDGNDADDDDDDDVIIGNKQQTSSHSLKQIESDKQDKLSQTSKEKETNEIMTDENDETTIDDTKNLIIPAGWKVGLSKCKRKFFYNDFNKDRWYLNLDPNGKHYFYNADNVSVWNLPGLNQTDETDDLSDETHFQKNFDDNLSTFKNLYTRLESLRRSSNDTRSESPDSCLSSQADQGNQNNISNNNPSTLINYSHKPPSELNSNFKCIVLAKNGKRCRKKNSENYKVTLASTKILFVKEIKTTSKLEFFVDFKGGKCYKIEKIVNQAKGSKEQEKERAELIELVGNSKSAFVVETLKGYKILLISENQNVVNDWISAINSIITQFQSEFSPIYEGPELLHSINHDTSLNSTQLCTSQLDTSNSKIVNKSKKDELEQENQKEEKVEKKNFINMFGLGTNRNKASIKECIFGANLINLSKRDKRIVPIFVDEIIAAIEAKGLDADGIYRISGNIVEVQKLRHQIDHNKQNYKDFDIHVLCGALKTFFRELEDPLIQFNLHSYFMNAISLQDKTAKFNQVQELIKKMNTTHRETLRHLLNHLVRVIEQSSSNRMSAQNIAMVYGPNIMRSAPINEENFGFSQNIMLQNYLVEYMLANFKELFSFQPNALFSEHTHSS